MTIKTRLGSSGHGIQRRGIFASMNPIEANPIGASNEFPVCRPILQSGVRSHSDAVGTWSQNGNVITIARAAHGVLVGDKYAFMPTAGTGTLPAAGLYDVATTPNANTLTLVSATSSTGAGTMAGTGKQIIYSGIVPGRSIGMNGSLKIYIRTGVNYSANAKTFELAFGGIAFAVYNAMNIASTEMMLLITNKNSETVQQKATGSGMFSNSGAYNTGNTWGTASIDTTTDQLVEIRVTKASGIETAFLDSILVEITPSLD